MWCGISSPVQAAGVTRWKRDPALVLADVRNEKITQSCALAEYGVALDSTALHVDRAETERIRAERRR